MPTRTFTPGEKVSYDQPYEPGKVMQDCKSAEVQAGPWAYMDVGCLKPGKHVSFDRFFDPKDAYDRQCVEKKEAETIRANMKKNAEVAAEKEYKAILDKARAEAQALLKDAEKEAAATRDGKKDKILQDAEKKANESLAEAKNKADDIINNAMIEAENHRVKLKEELGREAERKAKEMLTQAQAQTEQILSSAKAEADKQSRKWKDEAIKDAEKQGKDLVALGETFYAGIGLPIDDVIKRSDKPFGPHPAIDEADRAVFHPDSLHLERGPLSLLFQQIGDVAPGEAHHRRLRPHQRPGNPRLRAPHAGRLPHRVHLLLQAHLRLLPPLHGPHPHRLDRLGLRTGHRG